MAVLMEQHPVNITSLKRVARVAVGAPGRNRRDRVGRDRPDRRRCCGCRGSWRPQASTSSSRACLGAVRVAGEGGTPQGGPHGEPPALNDAYPPPGSRSEHGDA